MLKFATHLWHRYAISVAAVVVGAALAAPVQRWSGGGAPFVMFFPLVTLVAAVAGTGPGLLCTGLSALAVAMFWVEPQGAMTVATPGGLLALGLYVFAGTVVTAVGGSLRRAQLARRESEGLLKAVLDNTPGLIYMKDRRGVLRMVNRRFAELAGRPAEQIVGSTDRDTFGDSPQTRNIQENDQRVLAAGRVVEVEEALTRPDGEHTYLSIKVPFDYAGETMLCGFTTDVTDRKRAEESVRLHSRVLESMTEGVSVSDEGGLIIYTNAAEDRMFGYEAGELVGKHVSVLNAYPPEENRRIVESVIGELRKSGVWTGEWHNRRKDGSSFHTESHISALDAGGRKLWVCVQRDVTRQKLWQEALAAGEERLRMAQDAGGVGTFEYDVATGTSRGSEVFFRIFDAPPGAAEYSADDWGRLIHPLDRDGVFDALRRVMESPDATDCSDEYRLALPDGSVRWVSYRGRVRRDDSGRAVKIIGTVADVTGRRLAEEAVRQSELRFRALADGAPVAISVSRQGRHLYVNAAYRRCFATPDGADVVGASILDHVAPEDRARLMENVRRRYAGEAAQGSYQFTGLRADGSRFTAEVQAGQIDLPDGPASIAFLTDVTERRRAADALAESEGRFRRTADGAPVLIWIADTTNSCIWFNKPWLEFTGRPLEQERGDGWAAGIHPEDAPRRLRACADAFAARAPFVAEYRLRRHDGEYRWILDNGVPLSGPSGEFTGYIGSCVDFTDRKRAEDRLQLLADAGVLLASSLQYERSLEELARLVVPRLADWCAVDMLEPGGVLRRVAVAHPDPRLIAVAHELHRRFPPDPDAPGGTWQVAKTGKTACVPVITDEMLSLPPKHDDHLRALRELKLRSYLGVPLVARGRVLGVLTLIYAESGRTYGAEDVALAEDLARRAAVAVDNATLFDAERAARGEAERASRLKDDFLATLSHELRTPLNAILGWSQLIDQGPVDEETLKEGLSAISRNARAQTQLIEDLLDMSRIVSGKLRLNVQTVMPADVVAAAVESVLPAAGAKGLRVEQVLDPTAGPVSGDPGRLQQAVWNLLTNAVKFTPKGGKIQVVLERANSHVEVSVSDTGEGIKPEFLPHMFERFRQADASTTRRHGGLGIGLALVKQLAELHGGSVRVKSPGEGLGSTFTLCLPVAIARSRPPVDTAPALPTDAPAITEASLSGVSVLVVDDEPDARLLAKRILEERGAAVATAGTAKEALALLRDSRPNVLLSDIGMPEHDGYQFITWVRGLPPDEGGRTPAAAFTAFARSEDRQRALMAGYQSHLVKPVEPAELVTVVASLAGRTGPGNVKVLP